MKNRFEGELKHIDSRLLISKEKGNAVEDFFITLGLVFNDLKGLNLFILLLGDSYEKPEKNERTVHSGNYAGVLVQINKLIASIIHEFFKFLNENQQLLKDSEFNEILDKLPMAEKSIWLGLFAAARDDLKNTTDFLKAICKIRNNMGFHYYKSGQILREGYKSFFLRKDKSENEFAYYSIGNRIETTRFFFSDAASQEAALLMTGKTRGGEENESVDKYTKHFIETFKTLFPVIVNIFDKYLKLKRNQPH